LEVGNCGSEGDYNSGAFVGSDAREPGAETAGGNHGVCVAEGGGGGFKEDIVVIELGRSGDFMDLVGFVKL